MKTISDYSTYFFIVKTFACCCSFATTSNYTCSFVATCWFVALGAYTCSFTSIGSFVVLETCTCSFAFASWFATFIPSNIGA